MKDGNGGHGGRWRLLKLYFGATSPLRKLGVGLGAWAWGTGLGSGLWEGVLGCRGGLTVWCACCFSWASVAKTMLLPRGPAGCGGCRRVTCIRKPDVERPVTVTASCPGWDSEANEWAE